MLQATYFGDAASDSQLFYTVSNTWGLVGTGAGDPIPLPLGSLVNCGPNPKNLPCPSGMTCYDNQYFPQIPNCTFVQRMPVPPGSRLFKTPQGWGVIAIVPTAAQIQTLDKDIARALSTSCGKDARCSEDMRQAAAGTKHRYVVTNVFQEDIRYENAGATPPAGRPPVINPDDVAKDAANGEPGWYDYRKWLLFYGPATQGRILYVNVPVWISDRNFIGQAIGGIWNPFDKTWSKISTVASVIKDAVDDVMNEILPCDSPISDLVAKGFSQYGAQFFHAMRCAGTGPCPNGAPRNAQGLCNDPCLVRGMSLDPFTGNCIAMPGQETALSGILPYVLGGAALLGLAFYIRSRREEE